MGVTMRSDRPPFSDVRVRRALSLALNRPALIEAVADGAAVVNPPGLPLALKDWSLSVDQLGEGAQYYKHDPAEARRLLAQAGYARGFATVVDFHSFGETALVDGAQVIAKDLKEIGIEAKLNQREYGAYIATVPLGKYEGIVWGPSTPFLEPDSFLASAFLPDSPRNNMKVNDPPLTDMLLRQRRIQDPAKRRELILDIQRYLAKMVYRAEAYSLVLPAVWDPALKNYGPNLGYDYGGRLMAAWLDR
jgi:peptide/nickel transport system substrate-binding protein